MQERVDAENQKQRGRKQNHPRREMQESLGHLVAKEIGHQDERHDPDDIGRDRDRQDQGDKDRGVDQGRAAAQVDIQQADRREAYQGVHPRAGVLDQQLVLGDEDGDPFTGHGQARFMQKTCRGEGHELLERRGDDIQPELRRWNREGQIQQRKPQLRHQSTTECGVGDRQAGGI